MHLYFELSSVEVECSACNFLRAHTGAQAVSRMSSVALSDIWDLLISAGLPRLTKGCKQHMGVAVSTG